jgi:hypothetical protein
MLKSIALAGLEDLSLGKSLITRLQLEGTNGAENNVFQEMAR